MGDSGEEKGREWGIVGKKGREWGIVEKKGREWGIVGKKGRDINHTSLHSAGFTQCFFLKVKNQQKIGYLTFAIWPLPSDQAISARFNARKNIVSRNTVLHAKTDNFKLPLGDKVEEQR